MKRILGIAFAIVLLPLIAAAQENLDKPTITAEVRDNSIFVSWNSVPGANHYELYAWENVGKWQRLSGVGLQSTSFEHSILHDGATYHYTVVAVDADGNRGPWSDRVMAPFKPLSAPTLSVTLNGNTTDIEWSEVTGASGYSP